MWSTAWSDVNTTTSWIHLGVLVAVLAILAALFLLVAWQTWRTLAVAWDALLEFFRALFAWFFAVARLVPVVVLGFLVIAGLLYGLDRFAPQINQVERAIAPGPTVGGSPKQ
jgi:hypothetical protein